MAQGEISVIQTELKSQSLDVRLKRRDIRVAANCHIKVLTIFCCFAGPVYISVLFALGQDGEKFIHRELSAKMK